MRIGIDFDNTIVSYDALFHQVALEQDLIPGSLPISKAAVRNYLRSVGREEAWTEMQGCVYGARLREARPFPGVVEFFQACRNVRIPVCIISHKTRHPFRGKPHDLHAAAMDWLEQQAFFDPAGISLPRSQVFFESTREAKLERIQQWGCTHFIDDLPEFLAEPAFPRQVLRLLFDPNDLHNDDNRFLRVRCWNEIRELLMVDPGSSRDPAALLDLALPMARAHGATGNILFQPLTGGANNRVLRLRAEGFDRVIKIFFEHPDDPRDRFHAERTFYAHAWRQGVRCMPEPFGWDVANRLGLLGYVPGRKLHPEEVTAEALDQALDFVLAVNQGRASVPAGAIPLAAEACFTVAEHVDLVDRRLVRLDGIVGTSDPDIEAAAFVRDELRPAWAGVRAKITSEAGNQIRDLLPPSVRCLSPSDFGFHNALLGPDRRLRFFDFEYAGWDDPAKLLCDFFCQPQLPVNPAAWGPFTTTLDRFFTKDGSIARRAHLLLPAYQIKWCCILLNDYLPRDHARRAFAFGADPSPERKRGQLNRARQLLARIR